MAPAAAPLEILLDSETIVLRSAGGGDESHEEPPVLSGKLVLRLNERTSIKDISLVFSGRCKMNYADPAPTYKSHTTTVPIFFHNFSFLPEHAASKTHVHTLNAGVHDFPFSLALPNDLPGTLRTYLSSAVIDYRLKATVIRGSIVASTWTAKKAVQVLRGLGPDAAEFNSILEIENTWPNKIMYSFTLPHKAHVAGNEVPVSIRFTPLAKGVRVKEVNVEIRENVTLYGKNDAEHNETFAIFSRKDEVQPSSHGISRTPSRTQSRGPSQPGSAPLSRVTSGTNLAAANAGSSDSSARRSPPISMSPNQSVLAADLSRRLASVSMNNPNNSTSPSTSGPSSLAGPSHLGHSAPYSNPSSSNSGFAERIAGTLEPEIDYDHADDEDELPPEELHILLHYPIPPNVAPTNPANPVVISHRIKWSCLIANSDGHTSELRCALPLMILHNSFEDEARLASSGARNLLFGPSGALLPDSEAQAIVDLPAYKDHVLDRLGDSSRPDLHNYTPNPWAHVQHLSTVNTPSHSQPPSPERTPHPLPSLPLSNANFPTPDWSQPSTPSDINAATSSSRPTSSGSGFFSSMHLHKPKKFGSNSRNSSAADLPGRFEPVTGTSPDTSTKPTASNNRSQAAVPNPNAAINGEGSFYNQVPPYAVAAQPNNVTPLDFVRSLPSYENK